MHVLLIAPYIDGTDVGESLMAFKWAQCLSKKTDLTVLSLQRNGRERLELQLPEARVITWPEPSFLLRFERFNAMLKPAYPLFCRHVRRWIENALANGEQIDIGHQLMPLAMRYASPFRHFSIPYLVGPLGGMLDTPSAFRSELQSAQMFTKLRYFDDWRIRYDPWLRESYSKAAVILGVAPYTAELLAPIPLKRFVPLLELGVDDVEEVPVRTPPEGGLRLLHVGRGVRTKGLRDVIRAIALLDKHPQITLTSAGDGEDLPLCKAEVEQLGIADRVKFLGRVARSDIETLYESHDAFVFPSFREPTGGVLYEAMRWSLPIITAARGGPDWIIDDASGIRIPVTDPTQYAQDIAAAILQLADDPELRARLGRGARDKVLREGLWSKKAEYVVELYADVLRQPNADGST